MLAVEPHQGLLKEAQGREGVETLLATADEFVARPEFPKYNKFLMCHCAHHFPNPVATFKAMLQRMPADGRCMVINYPDEITLPLWRSARDSFNRHPHDPSKPMIEAGLAVEVHREVVSYHVTKSFWYKRIRGRVYSPLEMLTDEEIEQGIAELEETELRGVGLEEEFEIREINMCFVGTKPNQK